MKERWRPIVGWEKCYQVSDTGRVRSLVRMTRSGLKGGGLLRLQNRNAPDRYPFVKLVDSGRQSLQMIHRLVLLAFRGPCPQGIEGRHYDGNRHNNRLKNLLWGTRAENHADRLRHGRDNKGEKHGNARLTDKKVIYIRQQARDGRSYSDLARLLRVDPATVRYAAIRQTWRHIP